MWYNSHHHKRDEVIRTCDALLKQHAWLKNQFWCLFFFSPLSSSELSPHPVSVFTPGKALNNTFTLSKQWIKRHESARATVPTLQTAFISGCLSFILLLRFLLSSVQEGVVSPKVGVEGGLLSSRLTVRDSNDVVLICYHIQNTPPLVIFQSSSLLGAPPCDCSLLGVQRRLWVIWRFFLIFLADRCRLAPPLTSHPPSIKPRVILKHVLIKRHLCSFGGIFSWWKPKDRACPRREGARWRTPLCVFLFSSFSLPAVNLVGFSVTFIREGDLVHLKRQMKELEANYQEIEKR